MKQPFQVTHGRNLISESLCLCTDLRTWARFESLVCQGEINLWSWGFQDQSIFPLKAKIKKKSRSDPVNNFLSTCRHNDNQISAVRLFYTIKICISEKKKRKKVIEIYFLSNAIKILDWRVTTLTTLMTLTTLTTLTILTTSDNSDHSDHSDDSDDFNDSEDSDVSDKVYE